MKRVFSFVAALVVAMVVLVSCGAKSAFQADFDAANKAIEAKDYAAALTSLNKVASADKATAFDLILSASQMLAAFQGQIAAGEQADGVAVYTNMLNALNKAKAMENSDIDNAGVTALTNIDMFAQIPTIEAALQSFQNAADVTAEEVVEEAAEGEAE